MGHDIRVMLPGYAAINPRRFQIHNLLRMKDIEIPLAGLKEHAQVKSSYLNSENQKVLVYFLANERFFSRDGLYFHPLTKKYFADNDERFIFFCRGVLETLKRLRWQPDIIHCNDWQCGLIPAYLKSLYRNDPFFKNVRTIFTVYSLASHGTFPKASQVKTGIPQNLLSENGNDKLNFLRTGLTYADIITTLGHKADKGIRIDRKDNVVSMANGSTSQAHLAEKFVNLYRELTKNG